MADYQHRGSRGRRVLGADALVVARGLGWFSIGLGLIELLAPRFLANRLGLGSRNRLVTGYGLREIATGIGILAVQDPTRLIWSRVAGDVLDLTTLAVPLTGSVARKGGAAISFAAVLGVTILDVLCARTLSSR
jgi:hypothetical protein